MTTRFFLSLVLSLAPTLAASSAALAQDTAPTNERVVEVPRVCAEVGDAGLDPAARERDKHILERVLERAEMFVVDRDCSEVYRVVHDTTDGRLHVRLEGPRAVVNGTAEATAQVGDVYAMMLVDQRAARAEAEAHVAAMQQRVARKVAAATATTDEASTTEPANTIDGSPAEPSTIERPSVASLMPRDESDLMPRDQSDPAAPVSVRPNIGRLYGRAGIGGVGGGVGGGLAIAGGYRQPIGTSGAFDVSAGLVGALVGIKAEMLGVAPQAQTDPAKPSAVQSLYGGGGLSLSASPNGAGAGAELTGGVSFTRMFLQADLSLPFYSTSAGYPMAFSLSLGVTR